MSLTSFDTVMRREQFIEGERHVHRAVVGFRTGSGNALVRNDGGVVSTLELFRRRAVPLLAAGRIERHRWLLAFWLLGGAARPVQPGLRSSWLQLDACCACTPAGRYIPRAIRQLHFIGLLFGSCCRVLELLVCWPAAHVHHRQQARPRDIDCFSPVFAFCRMPYQTGSQLGRVGA